MTLPKAIYSHELNTCVVRNKATNSHDILPCLKVPTYYSIVRERSDEGNGWYGPMQSVKKAYKDTFIIVKDNKLYGILYSPYHMGIRTDIYQVSDKTPKEVMDFIKKHNL